MYEELLAKRFLYNSVEEWFIAFAVFLAILLFLYIFKNILLGKLKKLVNKTNSQIDNILVEGIGKISPTFYILVSLWGASQFLLLPDLAINIINWVTLAVVLYYATITLQKLVEYLVNTHIFGKITGDKGSTLIIKKFINQITKLLIWVIAILLLLQNLGIEISVLLGGLGVAGLAISFAMQNVLEDILAFFSIYFDKPFEIGDFVEVGGKMGTIKAVGVKSTRIETLQGEELVISNKELTSSQIHNHKKMQERRIVFHFRITYETDYKKLKKVNKIVQEIIENVDNVRFDRVHFQGYGDFSLDFEVVYYVATQDYYVYMDIQEKINFALFEAFEKEEIEFAYPTKRILLEK